MEVKVERAVGRGGWSPCRFGLERMERRKVGKAVCCVYCAFETFKGV